MTLAQSPEGATHGGCVIKSWAREEDGKAIIIFYTTIVIGE